MEGPKVPSEARRREAPRGVGSGAMPPENFPKINVKIAYFSAFLQAEMVSSPVASKQD